MCDRLSNDSILAPQCQAEKYIYLIGSPTILLLGTLGNVINLAVMSRAGLRSTPSAIFIKVLAVTDTISIWVGLGRHIAHKGWRVNIRELSPVSCQIQRFLLYTSMDSSAWILVALAAERFTAVCFPHKISQNATLKARLASVGVIIAAVMFNLHVFWTRGAQVVTDSKRNTTYTINCGYPRPEFADFWKKYQGWIGLAAYSIVPFFVMLAFNICIARTLRTLSKTMRMVRRRSSASAGDAAADAPRSDASRTLTVMLLSASTFFLCVGAPAFLYNSLEAAMDLGAVSPAHKTADAVVTLLNFTNHAANFYIYFITGRGFRSETRKVFHFCRKFLRRGLTSQPVMELQRKSTITSDSS